MTVIPNRLAGGTSILVWRKNIYVVTLLLVSIAAAAYIFLPPLAVITSESTRQSIDVRPQLLEFAAAKWYAIPRTQSVLSIPKFPPQMTIVKVCSICKTSYWMAFPTNLTLQHYYFAGENGIFIEMAIGLWDTAETRLANAVLSFGCQSGKSPALMVDVGMNTGYFSGMALAAGCRVVAFEPTKYHHPYALVTAMLSGYQDRFTLHRLAASDKTGEKIPFNDWSVDASAKTKQDGQDLPHVFTTRVDDVVHEDILYLKVDVEGHEPEVFRGLTEVLKNKVVLVILWEHSEVQRNQSVQLPADYLTKLGYFISELHHGGAGNFVAMHPRVDPILRETIMAMKAINMKDALSSHGLNWWNY